MQRHELGDGQLQVGSRKLNAPLLREPPVGQRSIEPAGDDARLVRRIGLFQVLELREQTAVFGRVATQPFFDLLAPFCTNAGDPGNQDDHRQNSRCAGYRNLHRCPPSPSVPCPEPAQCVSRSLVHRPLRYYTLSSTRRQ